MPPSKSSCGLWTLGGLSVPMTGLRICGLPSKALTLNAKYERREPDRCSLWPVSNRGSYDTECATAEPAMVVVRRRVNGGGLGRGLRHHGDCDLWFALGEGCLQYRRLHAAAIRLQGGRPG